MADRTALTAGIAAASIAAVVAATPALITPNNQDLQVSASAAAALATKKVATDVQLVAFTLPGVLSAFVYGYYDVTYFQADIDEAIPVAVADALEAAEEENGSDPLSAAEIATITAAATQGVYDDFESEFTLGSVPGAIYYTLDNLLPAEFDYDDHQLVLGFSTLFSELAADIGVPDLVTALIQDPLYTSLLIANALGVPAEIINFGIDPVDATFDILEALGLPTEVGDFVYDPVGTVLTALPVLSLLAYPVETVLALASAAGVPDEILNLITDPIDGAFDIAEGLGVDPIFREFASDPIGTILRALIPQAQAMNATLVAKGTPTDETASIASTSVDKTPKLFNLDLPKLELPKLDLPTPKEFVADVESVFTPKAKVDTLTVEAKDGTLVEGEAEVGGETEETTSPVKTKFKLPTPEKAIADFNDGLAKTAKHISDSLKPKKDTSEESDTKDAAKSDSSDTKKKPSFGGFGHKHKKAADAPSGGAAE